MSESESAAPRESVAVSNAVLLRVSARREAVLRDMLAFSSDGEGMDGPQVGWLVGSVDLDFKSDVLLPDGVMYLCSHESPPPFTPSARSLGKPTRSSNSYEAPPARPHSTSFLPDFLRGFVFRSTNLGEG